MSLWTPPPCPGSANLISFMGRLEGAHQVFLGLWGKYGGTLLVMKECPGVSYNDNTPRGAFSLAGL